ncbi:MAG: hypothetical protein ACON5A_04815 [Candidatus Comchoanobacterales bacterium]
MANRSGDEKNQKIEEKKLKYQKEFSNLSNYVFVPKKMAFGNPMVEDTILYEIKDRQNKEVIITFFEEDEEHIIKDVFIHDLSTREFPGEHYDYVDTKIYFERFNTMFKTYFGTYYYRNFYKSFIKVVKAIKLEKFRSLLSSEKVSAEDLSAFLYEFQDDDLEEYFEGMLPKENLNNTIQLINDFKKYFDTNNSEYLEYSEKFEKIYSKMMLKLKSDMLSINDSENSDNMIKLLDAEIYMNPISTNVLKSTLLVSNDDANQLFLQYEGHIFDGEMNGNKLKLFNRFIKSISPDLIGSKINKILPKLNGFISSGSINVEKLNFYKSMMKNLSSEVVYDVTIPVKKNILNQIKGARSKDKVDDGLIDILFDKMESLELEELRFEVFKQYQHQIMKFIIQKLEKNDPTYFNKLSNLPVTLSHFNGLVTQLGSLNSGLTTHHSDIISTYQEFREKLSNQFCDNMISKKGFTANNSAKAVINDMNLTQVMELQEKLLVKEDISISIKKLIDKRVNNFNSEAQTFANGLQNGGNYSLSLEDPVFLASVVEKVYSNSNLATAFKGQTNSFISQIGSDFRSEQTAIKKLALLKCYIGIRKSFDNSSNRGITLDGILNVSISLEAQKKIYFSGLQGIMEDQGFSDLLIDYLVDEDDIVEKLAAKLKQTNSDQETNDPKNMNQIEEEIGDKNQDKNATKKFFQKLIYFIIKGLNSRFKKIAKQLKKFRRSKSSYSKAVKAKFEGVISPEIKASKQTPGPRKSQK